MCAICVQHVCNMCAICMQHVCNTCAICVQHVRNMCATFVQHVCNMFATCAQVRATAARALGALVRGLGQEHIESMMPWLLSTLQSESSSVERSGAALGLAEVVAVLGPDYLAAIVPGIISGCADRSPIVREGNLTLLVHIPVTCKRLFEPYLERTLPCILNGLADESEGVRDTAMSAGMKFVLLYASRSLFLLTGNMCYPRSVFLLLLGCHCLQGLHKFILLYTFPSHFAAWLVSCL